ncbi:hypothetical protein [Desulfovibrio legallii]|uniref:Uncharacterized protein n=1 Tax=Desulfovibrio legallii TaxID=571438 RepID=A0A1G7LDJ2_9BACT|nr:hypothetical protein [Desulfovibrio legallii]SDF47632.1 hypothetical protein SAMN05192586_10638 [Desulfovibrio legallii]
MPLGIVFELLWLDTLELGGVVPPYGGLSFLLAFPLCRHFGLTQAGAALVPLFFSMLAAYAASWLELRQRAAQNVLAPALEAWCVGGRGGIPPSRAVLGAALRRAGWQLGFYALWFCVLYLLLAALTAGGHWPRLALVTWPAIYAAALLGAVLSLRTRQAYLVLAASLGCLALLFWLGA